MTLEAEFEAASRDAVEECRTLDYQPTVWISMMNEMGATGAARKIVVSGDIQSGFERLVHLGRLDLTIEFAVLCPKWDSLFDQPVREAAWWRLSQALRPKF